MRVRCEACGGDGRSRDPAWRSCWDCYGRGDIPTAPEDVRPEDLGRGIGLGITYTRDGRDRVAFVLTGLRRSTFLGPAPRTGRLPPDMMRIAAAMLAAYRENGSNPLTREAVDAILADVAEIPF